MNSPQWRHNFAVGRLFLIASVLVCVPASCARAATGWEFHQKWMTESFGRTARIQPFSFVYGGRPSSEFLSGWTHTSSSRTIDAKRIERTLKYNNPGIWEPTKRMLGQYKSVRHLFTGDFYTLSPYSTATNVWMAWQYDRPDLGEGMVQAFRRMESPQDTNLFKLRGLNEQAQYTVTNLDTRKSQKAMGSELMDKGLAIQIPNKTGSALITYKK